MGTTTVTVTTTTGATTGVTTPAASGSTALSVLDISGWAIGDTFFNAAISGLLFTVTGLIPATRRLDTDGRRLTTAGTIQFTPATNAVTPAGTALSVTSTATSTTSSTTSTYTTTLTDIATGTFITATAPAGSSFIRVLDTTGFAVGNTISISSITTMLFQILSIVPGTRRLDADGRRLTGSGGQFGITPALPQQVNVNDQVFVSGITVTTTTEMPWGWPWWAWFLLCCGLCCCLSLCCGSPLGVLPMLGGKKKPTKKPAPAPQPTVVEEVVTVEDEVPLTGGYGTGVPMASMAVPMASAAVPMASAAYPGTTGYPMAY